MPKVEFNGKIYQIEVDSYNPKVDAIIHREPENCYEYEPEEVEWHANTGCILTDIALENSEEACEQIEEQLFEIINETILVMKKTL